MPYLPKKCCVYPNCGMLVPSKERYCEEHAKKVSKDYEQTRETAVKRGYTKRWQKIRKIKLAQDPMCECNACREQRLAANIVHHIDGNPKNNASRNLMSMNDSCHNRLHAKRGDRFGKAN